ncbi:anti-sigma factor domain-containing protein [Paenibacillus sp. N3.4]|uniref:anti-sigma factor domain-containing protein n=1 Tax=Paenibacillus sp. N3.4 TaxID=2603222 RepID=UPI0011C81DA0|nr:anti-sigma factor [Paenibacillus sp. N3.4]TXK83841.1 hypothetical protein FU659_12185 [Paenibacillus sp. N3.4]
MKGQERVDCGFLIEYLTGECTEWERAAFERHLHTCESCREELKDLRLVWQALPFQMEEVEVPADLKQQVMQSIHPKLPRKRQTWTRKWTYGISAVLLLGLAGFALWNYQTTHSQQNAHNLLSQPAEVIRTYKLISANSSMPSATGTAWIVQHGDSNNVVVNLSGLKETEGDWTYQVWLNHDGKKYNCGTLRVDKEGVGVLTYNVPVKNLQIDSIGVTLEPDPNGSKPRGVKVMGT